MKSVTKIRITLLSIALLCAIAFLLRAWEIKETLPLPFDDQFVEYNEIIPPYQGPSAINGMPGEKIWIANKGSSVISPNGIFHFPSSVTHVWIDVGASMLETTRKELFSREDIGLIAVEPLKECWNKWPKHNRLIALPFALNDTEGEQLFYQTKASNWSSLLKGVSSNTYRKDREIVKEVPVEVFHLSRILELVPEDLTIELLKVDVQGRDLEVLKSGGDLLRRVKKIKTEVILQPLYEGDRGDEESPEEFFTSYLQSLGFELAGRQVFELVNDILGQRARFFADLTYENTAQNEVSLLD